LVGSAVLMPIQNVVERNAGTSAEHAAVRCLKMRAKPAPINDLEA
jgi:hypothetical protein